MPKAETRPITTRASSPSTSNVIDIMSRLSRLAEAPEPRGPATVTDLKAFRDRRRTIPNFDEARMTSLLMIILTPIMEKHATEMALLTYNLQLQHSRELRRIAKSRKGGAS